MGTLDPKMANQKHIAVIGSGISGLSAAWLISKTMRVTLYESDTRLGGHSNTVIAKTQHGSTPVDTGFIVYNERNYPNLIALFNEIGVETQESSMSFAVSLNDGNLEYSGSGLNGLLGQRSNIFKPRFWFMVKDVLRFYKEAPLVINSNDYSDVTLGEYLDANNYGKSFVNEHLLPMGAAIWSASAKEMRAYPLQAFVRFFVSHGLLTLNDRPQWRTVKGGSRRYVERLSQSINGDIRLNTPVVKIERNDNGVIVHDSNGRIDHYDGIVIATHADQALSILSDASQQETQLLSAFSYTPNTAVLHTDANLMPKRKRTWSSWNYIEGQEEHTNKSLCVTYWMNELQNIDRNNPLFVTLNPSKQIAPDKILQEIHYEHPLFNRDALEAQKALWDLQGDRNTWFCGAYFGYGFHEDGLQSGLAVAEEIANIKRPWNVANHSSRISRPSQ